MNDLREDCANCGHDKATHHAELESTGDVTCPGVSGRVVYGSCLGSWCNCRRYVPRDHRND